MSEHRHQVDKSERNQSEQHKMSHFLHIHALILAHFLSQNSTAYQWKSYL